MTRLFPLKCPFHSQGCSAKFRSQRGRTYHVRSFHENHNEFSSDDDSSEDGASDPRPDSPPLRAGACQNEAPGYAECEDQTDEPLDANFVAPPLDSPSTSSPVSEEEMPPQGNQKIYHPYLTGMF